ncbi:MAG: sigma-54 dependent transcriptional regulator [Ignavibacteria bacterium]|nr:sigma-54 dependent transcriptional regulator [Ignavibacteria bacterium]MBT8382182.1 sigma-54 dependent transcriptional regulator [Ignavibacteria bacterium]MBT8390884.1 sigma-54 dependent transcriptional regulator [Ignavibacteria bacterium]NNJ51734.1 sigma-54-dependent Fis family transcriptional regulator [Ignavibacteriaceae bacterium]NNL20923.1 sigma-54-dependent Fis family transcriptional regulator [Ignavibacteriaceae bacterium]
MERNPILVVDDEPSYLELMKGILNDEGYTNVITKENPLDVLPLLERTDVDLILLDIFMPQMNGLDLLEKVYAEYPSIPVIVITAVEEVQIALKAIKLGAYEFITKPPDTDRLFITIRRALTKRLLESERDSLRRSIIEQKPLKIRFPDIITDSPVISKVFDIVEIFAPTNETILIAGETGTGKDLIARKIHDLSPRKDKPFVAVNLASISSSLFESELFGYKKGTFTGAVEDKSGYFESANGGTVFLDEIGELPLSLQGKLLRTIQYNEIYRIGEAKPIKLNLRIISATNRNLLEAVSKKEFRADLYYRLNRGYIYLPPLRQRGDDVIILAEHFLEVGNKTYNRNIQGFSEEVLDDLRNYQFPGNIRELENIILNAVARTLDDNYISSVDLPEEYIKNRERKSEKIKLITISDAEEDHIVNVMKSVGNSVQRAAPILGVSERTLQRKLKTLREKNS